MERIVLFDGVCNFCNGAVNFIIRQDCDGRFMFAALQSDVGKDLQAKYKIPSNVDSIILIENEDAILHSTAALRIARGLGGVWSLLYVFVFVPTPIRDWFYKLFADKSGSH